MKTGKRITDMAAYTPIEPVDILATRLGIPVDQITKLDANENPYGPSPLVYQALAELNSINIYPDPESRILRSRLSEVYDVPFENILTGSGADELIDLLVRVLLEPGDRVINCVPTFGMYDFDTALNYGVCLNIPRRSNFSLNMKAIEKAVKKEQPGVIFACSPNNPDGRRLTGEETDFLLSLPALIVLDEAYIEFTQQNGDLGVNNSMIRQVAVRDNLIVLRTFSKWAGLAGLRIGYGVFPTWLMDSLWKAKQPYNVNVAASAAACASLQDRDYLADNVSKIQAERSRLYQKLLALPGITPFPSQSNFILCKVDGRSARDVKAELAVKGVFIRHYETALLRNYIRISVGRPGDTDILIRQLEELL